MASVAKRKWTYQGQQREAWVVRYKDRSGAHRSKQFDRKKEADEYRRTVEDELDAGTHVARSQSLTLGRAIDEFLAHSDRRLASSQIGAGRRRNLGNMLAHVRAWRPDILLCDLTWQDCEAFMAHLLALDSPRKIHPTYARCIYNNFSSLLAWAHRRGAIGTNPAQAAKSEIGKAPSYRIETFSKDEVRAILPALEIREYRHKTRTLAAARAVVYLAAFCGLRKGEILALKWEAIDFQRGLVTVAHSLTQDDLLKGPKSKAGYRTVPMPKVVAWALEQWRPHVVPEERGLIFRRWKGGPWKGRFYEILWHPVLRRAGLQPDENGSYRHFHALRHFAGSVWLDHGATLPVVSQLLGHADVAITAKIYAHALEKPEQSSALLQGAADHICAPQPLRIAQELRNAA